jgi:hypothetical protein
MRGCVQAREAAVPAGEPSGELTVFAVFGFRAAAFAAAVMPPNNSLAAISAPRPRHPSFCSA